MKKIIGVVAPGRLFETENSREDTYNFGNNYGKRIMEAGGLPFGLLPVDGYISEELLEKCDAFVICGGYAHWPYHFQVMQHALKTGKCVLGICLGMQLIHRTFKLLDYKEEQGLLGEIHEIFAELKKTNSNPMLEKVEGHRYDMITGREDESKHSVNLLTGSFISELVGTDVVYGGSFHRYRVIEPSKQLLVSGTAEDGTIEIIEYKKQFLGLQFHPEIDTKLMKVFEWICK